jgi:hypothetical protein
MRIILRQCKSRSGCGTDTTASHQTHLTALHGDDAAAAPADSLVNIF